jgi:hypothetical protein
MIEIKAIATRKAEDHKWMASKCTKDAIEKGKILCSIGGRKRSLAGKTVYQNVSIDTSFDPPLFSFDSIL